MSYLKSMSLLVITVLLLSAGPILAGDGHVHEGDIIMGRTLADQLAIEADLAEHIGLEPSVNPFFPGWLGDEPGFDELDVDEPGEGFYTLLSGADIWIELVSKDTGLIFADLTGSTTINPGESLQLGTHGHILFNIEPGYGDQELSATFFLKDLGGTGMTNSDQFTMHFESVPEPTTIVLLGIGALALRRRFRNVG